MRSLAFLAVLLAAPVAAAEDASPPAVLCLTEKSVPGSITTTLAVLRAGEEPTVVLGELPFGGYELAIHAATGRWAMVFHQISTGDPLVIGGKKVSKPLDRNTLVLGDLGGATAAVYGDPACTSKKKACFERPRLFSDDGAYVFVQSLGPGWSTTSRWTFGARPKRAAVADKKLGEIEVSPDRKRVAYVAKDGIHVTTWPAQKKKAVKVKASKKAKVATPDLLMSLVFPIGERLYWFRREPTEQKRGWYEAYDLATAKTITLHEATTDFPLLRGEFRSTGPRGTVLFLDDVAFERANVMEVAADGDQAEVAAKDVRQILDVSADGRYLLATRRKDPARPETADNPELVVVIDLASREDVAVLDAGGDGVRVVRAGFVAE